MAGEQSSPRRPEQGLFSAGAAFGGLPLRLGDARFKITSAPVAAALQRAIAPSRPGLTQLAAAAAESPTAAAFRLLTDGEFEWALGELHNQAAAGGEEPQADTSGAALHPTASASNLAAAAAAAEQQQQQQAAAAAAAPQTAPAQATNSVSMAEVGRASP